MDPAPLPVGRFIRVGDLVLDSDRNTVWRAGCELRLRPKVMDVLMALAECDPGTVVPKATLVDRVWPNEAVADSVLCRAVFELRQVLGDDPRQPRLIATVARHGYRLLPPVEKAPDTWQPRVAPVTTTAAAAPRRRLLLPLAAGVLLAAATATILWGPARAVATPATFGEASMVVLPFAASGKPADPFLADAIAEELATDMTLTRTLTVIRRPTPVPGADPVAVARDLGAGQLLTGTITWPIGPGGAVLVEARIVRVRDGKVMDSVVVTAESGSPLDIQDVVTRAIVGHLRETPPSL